MRKMIMFLDQQGWLGGAQRVLEATLDSVASEYDCVVAFPEWGSFRSFLVAKGVETIDLPVGSYEPGRKSLWAMASFACRSLYCGLKLSLVVRKKDIALIYINGPRCLPAGTLAAWLTGRPAIFHLHLILTRKTEIILARAMAWRITRVFACSSAAAASLIGDNQALAEKTRILYNPLTWGDPRAVRRPPKAAYRSDPEGGPDVKKKSLPFAHGGGHQRGAIFRRASVKGRYTVGIVGRITECKGHHLLLEAVAALPEELRPRVRVLVVGAEAPGCESDAQYARRLRDDANRYGLERQIDWAGYQPDPRPYYDLMDVLVQPSLAEAMCLAILEALDRGVPVIAARTGGIPEVVHDGVNGLLVSLEDKTALSRALTVFFKERKLREHLRNGARRGLDGRFSMENFVSRVRSTIEQLCPQPPN